MDKETSPIHGLFSFSRFLHLLLWNEELHRKERNDMAFLSMIFFGFLGICGLVGCIRAAKLAIRAINGLFDKLEDKFK